MRYQINARNTDCNLHVTFIQQNQATKFYWNNQLPFFCKIFLSLIVSSRRVTNSMHLLGQHHLMFHKSCSDHLQNKLGSLMWPHFQLWSFNIKIVICFSLFFCLASILNDATNCFFLQVYCIFPSGRIVTCLLMLQQFCFGLGRSQSSSWWPRASIMRNSYVVCHVSLSLTKPFSKLLSLSGSANFCTVAVISVMYQARGHEKALQWLEKAMNKILLQADDLTSKVKS